MRDDAGYLDDAGYNKLITGIVVAGSSDTIMLKSSKNLYFYLGLSIKLKKAHTQANLHHVFVLAMLYLLECLNE